MQKELNVPRIQKWRSDVPKIFKGGNYHILRKRCRKRGKEAINYVFAQFNALRNVPWDPGYNFFWSEIDRQTDKQTHVRIVCCLKQEGCLTETETR